MANRKLFLASMMLLAVCIIGFSVVRFFRTQKAYSLLEQLQRKTNSAEVQEWALKEIERSGEERRELNSLTAFLDLPDDGLPGSVYVERAADQSWLVAQWGSGFGHWGLLVGDDHLQYPYSDYFYIEWARGVFVWQEGER